MAFSVTKEDQDNINRFARLNARLEEAQQELNNCQNEVRDFEDCINAIEFDPVHLQVGELLVESEPEETQEWLESRLQDKKKLVDQLGEKIGTITAEMTELKSHLYARFGDNIHLENSAPPGPVYK